MRRALAFLVLLSLLFPVFAGSRSVALAQAGPSLGAAVPIPGPDGAEIAQITVEGFEDPVDLYDPNRPPARGYRIVLVSFTIANTGSQPFSFDPSHIYPVDDDGFLVGPVSTEFAPELNVAPLTAQDIPAGASVSGEIAFQVLTGIGIQQIVYWPDSSRLVPLVHLAEEMPGVGSEVPIFTYDVTVAQVVTINQVLDPYNGYDLNNPPQRGNRYAMLDVTVFNAGQRPTAVDPNDFALVDTDGFIVGPSGFNHGENPPADMAYTDPLEAGGSVSGGIGFQLLAGVEIAAVYYIPSSDRLIEVANIASGGAAPAGEATPAATEPPEELTGVVECTQQFSDYIDFTNDSFTMANTTAAMMPQVDRATAADVQAIRDAAAAFGILADQQESVPVPDVAAEFNALAVEYFRGMSQGLDFLADALENNDPASQLVAINEVEQIMAVGGEANQAFEELLAACPLA
jgi:Domain of unknown function (DUF4352)